MNSRLRTDRSTETPMDFQFDSPVRNSKPVWAQSGEDPYTPKKRGFNDVNPLTPSFPTPSTPSRPTFGQHSSYPFLFPEPVFQNSHTPAWTPPSNFSPTKAFPQPELPDVDMNESSPTAPSPEKDADGERTMAVGALRRVYRKRNGRDRSLLGRPRARVDDGESSEEGSGGEEDRYAPLTQKTTNHYTLNMPGPSAPQSDLPFRLLGFVQVFFNGSLAAIAIYLLVQFIFTIQRDVEHRIGEYSMDIVQEIAQCTLAYKTNLCAQGTVPAMAAQCASWETCMNRDPTKVGRAKVSVEVIGEVIDSFVEPISWKTLGFTVAALAFMTLFINSLLMLFRSRVNPATHHVAPPIPPYPMVAGIPYHAHAHQGYLPPSQNWNGKAWNGADDDEKTTRRRRLEGGQAVKVK